MINKIKKLWNGLLVFSIVTSLLVLFAQILLVSLILSVNMSLAFTLIFIFFVIDAIVVVTFSKKRIESDILNISFIVLILSSPLVYGLVYYLKVFYLPINPQVVHIGSIDTWIGFAGSILSGLLVMISLVYTIKYERQIRDEESKRREVELAILSTPVLSFELYEEKTKRPRRYRMMKSNDNQIQFTLLSNFYIKNTSTNFAIISSFDTIAIERRNYSDKFIENIKKNTNITCESKSGEYIPPNTSFLVDFDINCTISNLDTIFFKFNLEFYDFTNKNKYSVDAEMCLLIRIIEDDEIDNLVVDGEEIIIPVDQYYIEVTYGGFVNKFKKILIT